MTDNLLYFPYIAIPQNKWTIKSLLYWDNIGIIVPPDFAHNPDQHEQSTIELLQTDLITQVFPDYYLYDLPKFSSSFLTLIDQPTFNLKKRQKKFEVGKFSRIHIQKFGGELLDQLVELKLAKRQNWMWYDVENKTARLLMIYLATVIGKVGNFTPATDKIRNLDTSLSQTGRTAKIQELRQSLIENLIPYPINPDLTQLRKFKDKYHDQLKSFRVLLEKSVNQIAVIKSRADRNQNTEHIILEIEDKKSQILSDLNESKFSKISFGTICPLIVAATSFQEEQNLVGLASLANTVYSVFKDFDNSQILKKDYSYLALVEKKFITS